jgi:hypothetical protein
MELMPQWDEFCKYREQLQLPDDEFMKVLQDRQRKAIKAAESRKEQKRQERIQKVNRFYTVFHALM